MRIASQLRRPYGRLYIAATTTERCAWMGVTRTVYTYTSRSPHSHPSLWCGVSARAPVPVLRALPVKVSGFGVVDGSLASRTARSIHAIHATRLRFVFFLIQAA